MTTKKVLPDASLARLMGIFQAHNPNLFELLQVKTEEGFVAATENALERAIRTIESDNNGHVDVVVEHSFGGRWKYLGECKIYKGFRYHLDGCKQLLGYCTGRELRAFALDFFKVPAMLSKLATLRKQMDTKKPLKQTGKSRHHAIKGAFTTTHNHANGGGVEILHVGCSVFILN